MYVNTPERRSHKCLDKNHKFGSFFAICVIFFFMAENFRFFPNASFNTFDLIWHRSIWKYTNSYRFLAPRDCRNASTSSILFRWNLANGTRRFCFPREVPKKFFFSKRFIFNFFRRNTIWNCHASVLFVFIFKPISFAVRYVPKIGNELLRDFPHYANVSFLWFRMYISPTHIGHAVGTPINKIFVASFWARLSGR